MPASLAAASPLAGTVWLALRILGAIVTVPIAEQLAFRGLLYRRLVSADLGEPDELSGQIVVFRIS